MGEHVHGNRMTNPLGARASWTMPERDDLARRLEAAERERDANGASLKIALDGIIKAQNERDRAEAAAREAEERIAQALKFCDSSRTGLVSVVAIRHALTHEARVARRDRDRPA